MMTSPKKTNVDWQEQVFASQVRLLYQHAHVSLLATVIVSAIFVAVLWRIMPQSYLIEWFVATLLLSSVRAVLIARFHRTKVQPESAKLWCRRFLIGSALSGALWGLAGVIFFPWQNVIHQAVIITMLMGMVAGGAPLMASVERVYAAFIVPMLAPICFSLLLQGTLIYAALGLLGIIYLVAMLSTSRRIHRVIRESLRLGYENLSLIERVSTSKHELELTNKKLTEEAADRLHAQQSLRYAYDQQEEQITNRTQQLTRANKLLKQENAVRKRVEEELFEQKERAEVTLHSISDGVIATDSQGRIEYMNAAAESLTGWKLNESVSQLYNNILTLVDETSMQNIISPVSETINDGNVRTLPSQSSLVSRDGNHIAVESVIAPIRDRSNEVVGAVIVIRDVQEERELRNQLFHQARHDALTGLQNRRAFEETLSLLLESAHRDGDIHALLYLDLDQFKIVNDTCGHIAGDELLKQLTTLFHNEVRGTDMVARLGGDEFGVLLARCPLERARRVAIQLKEMIKDFRFVWQNRTFDLGASVGVAMITPESESISQVMSAADMACYAAKDLGRNRIHVYSMDDRTLTHRRSEMTWISRLKAALNDNRLVLYSQPITALSSASDNAPVNYEILLRMIDEDGTLVLPGAFIPAAERYNFMPTLDRWVITNTIEHYHELYSSAPAGSPKPLFSINVSGASLSDDTFLKFIKKTLKRHPLPANRLCLEITETAAIANLSIVVALIEELKGYGCLFSLDDFGSGVSSFGYLKNLNIDFLKIDGGFVADMANDPVDYAMVEAINHIGHVMGKKTIAESAENENILTCLRTIGVDFVQGYGVAATHTTFTTEQVSR